MKLGVLGNCQNAGFGRAFRALLPASEVINFGYPDIMHQPEKRAAARAALATCDLVFAADYRRDLGDLSHECLRTICRQVVAVPPVIFAGFHPDICALLPSQAKDGAEMRGLWGPTHELQSRIAIAAFLGGLHAEDAESLYGRLAFNRLGYFGKFAEHRTLMLEKYRHCGLDLTSIFAKWLRQGAFMHSPSHPKIGAIVDIAALLCQHLGLATHQPPDDLPDDLAHEATHPVYPDLADEFGMPRQNVEFKPKARPGQQVEAMPLARFLHESFAVFRRQPAGLLLRLNGVSEAMAALDLKLQR